MTHPCPECDDDGRKRGWTCDLCNGTTVLDESEWHQWCDFDADRGADQLNQWLNDFQLRKAGWWPK